MIGFDRGQRVLGRGVVKLDAGVEGIGLEC